MTQKHNCGQRTMLTSVEKLLAVCEDPVPGYALVPEGWELELPRVRGESGQDEWDVDAHGGWWVAECWWRSRETGCLGYYAKKNLTTMMLQEFRELPPGMPMAAERNPDGEHAYLEKAVMALQNGEPEWDTAEVLDDLWKQLASEDMKVLDPRPRRRQYLLPREAVEYWDWETLKALLLKRYDTTEEELRDYLEYQASGSEERYVPARYREECRAKGIRFWRDGYDGE